MAWPNVKPISAAQAPLATIAMVTSHSRPHLSATRPPHTQPTPPIAMAEKDTSDASESREGPGGTPDAAALAATKTGIHVHALYSSNMCPRYPPVAKRHRRSRKTVATRPHEKRRGGNGYGPSRYQISTSKAAIIAAALEVSTTGVSPAPRSACTR